MEPLQTSTHMGSTVWTLQCGLHMVNSIWWTPYGGLYMVDSIIWWTLHGGLYMVGSTVQTQHIPWSCGQLLVSPILTTKPDSFTKKQAPEEGDTVEGLLLPQHVLGGHSTVIVSNLPVSDISSVSDEWEGESYNVSTSIHILTRLHGL